MILGRPTNLWLGLVTSVAGVVTILAIASGADPELVANLVGGGVSVLGAAITLIANTPPTLEEGDRYTIQTPKGEPNYEAVVAQPPAPSQPVPVEGGTE